jgi:hypothetical protein
MFLEKQTASIFKVKESPWYEKSGTDIGSSLFWTLVLPFCMLYHLAYSSTLNSEAVCASETLQYKH